MNDSFSGVAFVVCNILLAVTPLFFNLIDRKLIKGNKRLGTVDRYRRRITPEGQCFLLLVAVTVVFGIKAYNIETEKDNLASEQMSNLQQQVFLQNQNFARREREFNSTISWIKDTLGSKGIIVNDTTQKITFTREFIANQINESPFITFKGSGNVERNQFKLTRSYRFIDTVKQK